ncbi:MAG: LCP family protein [Streptosporangiaceae bacterium]
MHSRGFNQQMDDGEDTGRLRPPSFAAPSASRRHGGGAPRARRMAGRAGYGLACIAASLALVISGLSYFLVRDVSSIGGSHAIVSGPSIGPQNILLMGLESRRGWNGNILPRSVLAKLHAGSRQGVLNGVGGNDTNTLILIHVFAGGRRAVGFSIPRDDWVNFAGTVGPQQQGKIDQAYGVSMYFEQGILRQKYPSMSQDQLAFLGNEAGRKAAVDTVEKLTGAHVDHFAEVNLDGFYQLAKVFGGVEVCLRHPVNDPYSGAHFRAGYQHLNAEQALAFVRQRHGLANGDLDRTHRQQAFLDSVMHQLRTEGTLSDLSKLQALLAVAKRYVITDSGWNLLDFAAQMRGLTSGNLVFHTLPIKGYALIDGQDANVVAPAQIKTIVHAAFYPKPAVHRSRGPRAPQAKSITVDVRNGGYTAGLAGQVSAKFAAAGYRTGKPGNTAYRAVTAIRYGAGAAAAAQAIARLFGVTAVVTATIPAGQVHVLLGAAATVPASIPAIGPATGASHAAGAPASPAAIPTTGPQGGAVSARDGIPCVN